MLIRKPLSPEEIAEIEARPPRDEDCPEMTDEQRRQFKRVHPLSDAAEPV